jgi:hypothetical protein
VASPPRSRPRWPLHPLTAALALLLAGAFGVSGAAFALRDLAEAGAVLVLLVVAGAAAGFATSGST